MQKSNFMSVHHYSIRNNDVDKPVARRFHTANHSISDINVCAISPISGRKKHEKRLILKIGTIHTHGLNEWSLHSLKAVTSHLFTPFFMFVHLALIDFPPPPRLPIDFKNSKWLTYSCILLCITMHLLLFLSSDWLIFCHIIISLI